MTSMWMVQNDYGNYLNWNAISGEYEFTSGIGQTFSERYAENMAQDKGGHPVEMVPAKAKAPVSREEANMLGTAHEDYVVHPAGYILDYVNANSYHDENIRANEDRLLRAYVEGYKVEKPTQYNVKVPHTTHSYYAWHRGTGELETWDKQDDAQMSMPTFCFTMDHIKYYGLEDCERVVVNTEGSND